MKYLTLCLFYMWNGFLVVVNHLILNLLDKYPSPKGLLGALYPPRNTLSVST